MKPFMNLLLAWLTGLTLLGLGWLSISGMSVAGQSSVCSAHLVVGNTPSVLVDDFEEGNLLKNKLGGEVKWWGANTGQITCTIQDRENNRYLDMQYTVAMSSDAYAVYASGLLGMDLTAYEAVWVAVKGENGSEPIYVEFANCGPDQKYPKQEIDDYLAQGIITSEWSGVVIPLEKFSEITNWACIERVSLLAHNEIGSGQGRIYVDDIRLLPASVLVDDFHEEKEENELGGGFSTWDDGYGSMTYDHLGGELRLDYDVRLTSPPADAVYYTLLRNTNLLTDKNALLFKVRGDEGAEEIAIEFQDCGLGGTIHYPKVRVGDYLSGGISSDWLGVAIPLAAFVDGMNWRCVKQLNFLASAEPWLGSGQGTVFIDDIYFVSTHQPVPLYVDRFDDCDQWNSMTQQWLGGTWETATLEHGPDTNASHRYGDTGCSYRLAYNVEDSEAAAWLLAELKGLDVTDYTHLSFMLKGAAGKEELHVYLKDGTVEDRYKTVLAEDNWQEVLIPLDHYSPTVQLANLSKLEIKFEKRPMTGEAYIDDIRFVKPTWTHLPVIHKNWRPLKQVDLYLHNYTGGDVSYTVHGIGTKTVPDTTGGEPFYWGSFPVGTYDVSWYKTSDPSCGNSGTRTYEPGYYEPDPMRCN